ncbi:MAG: insulinase family protein [Marinilabiliales bacterium]|nr:MAG: insulinase family protein [Marinilabiliales bacterium]
MKKHFLQFLILLALLPGMTAVYAQQDNFAVPMDSEVRYGKLENGLTYYIRENAIPEDRAEFYLVVDAGAILENPDQNGLAHFCEHMAFNGTENFEKHQIVEWLQSIGMKFGPEINAYTTQDNTTYMLQKVPVDIPENIDTALLILHDWAGKVSYEAEEIDNERGVIHEEWRVRRGADFRMMNEYQKVVFKDSKYAVHDVIGDIDIIDNHDYETIRSFYRDWYRPNLQAIIAVGDFDAEVIEQKIKEQFGTLRNPENMRERVEFSVPDHDETYVSVVTDKEATQTMSLVFYKHNPPAVKDMAYYRESILQQLYTIMINQRLQELLTSKKPPFVYGFSAYIPYIRTVDAYLAGALANNNEALSALEAVLIENRRVMQFGFTQSEFERSVEEFQSMVEKMYKEKDKKKSSEYMNQYQSHFLDNEPVPGIEFDNDFVAKTLPELSVEEINELAKKYIRHKNRVVVVTGPDKEEVVMPTKEEVLALLDKVEQMELDPWEDKVVDAPLVSDVPEKGKRDSKKKDKEKGTETWVLKNGITVVFKPTEFKDDEILMSAWSHGGMSAVKTKYLPSAAVATDLIMESGIGKHDKNSLQKKLAGKNVSVAPYINSTSEGFRGSCSPKDFETMLQLTYLYFTEPRMDADAAEGLMLRTRGMLENRSARPATALSDTILMTMAQYHPRVEPFTAEYLDRADPDRAFKIFRRRFGDPSGFTFYFVGNIDPKEARPLIELWLGGLPLAERDEFITNHGVEAPEKSLKKVIQRSMETPQGTVAIVLPGEFDYDNARERTLMTAVKDILDVRYTETIREDEGGTYGVMVQLSQSKYPDEDYSFKVMFNTDPERVDELKAIVYREMESLMTEGPAEKDVKGFKENMIKTYAENLKENRFWISALSSSDRLGTGYMSLEDYSAMIRSISAEEIKSAAKRYLDTEKMEFIMLPE